MSEPKPAIPRPRIQGLSDLIFGLALSIGSIQLLSITGITSGGDILAALVVFGFSFLILINVWLRYTSITSVLPIETVAMVRLNVLLLFLVAIEPYLFNLLVKYGLGSLVGQDASAIYAWDIAGMNLVIAYFTHLTTIEGKKLIPENLIHRYKLSRNYALIVGLIFLVSSFPAFATSGLLGTNLREILWIMTVPVILLSRISSKTPA